MAMKRLSPAQQDVLRDAANRLLWRSERIGDLYDSYSTSRGKCNPQVNVLCAAGLIRIGEQSGVRRPWLITEAGVRVLASLDYANRPKRK